MDWAVLIGFTGVVLGLFIDIWKTHRDTKWLSKEHSGLSREQEGLSKEHTSIKQDIADKKNLLHDDHIALDKNIERVERTVSSIQNRILEESGRRETIEKSLTKEQLDIQKVIDAVAAQNNQMAQLQIKCASLEQKLADALRENQELKQIINRWSQQQNNGQSPYWDGPTMSL